MPCILEGAQLTQHDGVAEMDIRGGRVDPELHAQRASERQLAVELAAREDVHRAPLKQLRVGRAHAGNARLRSFRGAVRVEAPPGGWSP